MALYRCPCGNIQLRASEPNGGGPTDESEGGRKPPTSSASVTHVPNVDVVFAPLIKTSAEGVVTCLVCGTETYKTVEGKPSEAEPLVTGREDPPRKSSAFSASLELVVPSPSSSTSAPPRTRRYPSPPAAATSFADPSTLLPPLREPFFLPAPFSPAHPAFHAISDKVDAHLRDERQRLVDEIDSLLAQKRAELEAVEEKARTDVEQVWAAFEDGEAEREENAEDGAEKVVQGAATPKKTTERFPKELEMMTSSVSSLAPPGSTAVAGSYKSGFVLPSPGAPSPLTTRPATSIVVPRSGNNASSSGLSPLPSSPASAISPNSATAPTSLLSASLSRGSYLNTKPPAYVDDRPPRPPPAPRSGFSDIAPPPPPPSDKDLAVSMIASTWQEPANLIFRSSKQTPKLRPDTVKEEQSPSVGVLGRGGESESFKEREERMSTQPVVKTPPSASESNGGGEQEIGFIEEEGRREANAGGSTTTGSAAALKGKGKTPKSPKKKVVTFAEPAPPEVDDGREEEEDAGEAIMDGHHEEVFDFEEPELPSSSPSPSPVAEKPISPLPALQQLPPLPSSSNAVPSSSRRLSSPAPLLPEPETGDSRTPRAPVKLEPMYTLDGRAIRPVQPSKSTSRSPNVSADRRAQMDRELRDGEGNRVLVSMKRLTGADLPSHRAAWKDKPRNWQIYGRFGGRERTESSESDDVPAETHYGQSLPVNIVLPPSKPGTTTSSTHLGSALPSLERKTSLSDRTMLVPPLRTRASHTSTTSRTSTTSSVGSGSRTSPSDLVRETSAGSETRSRRPGSRRGSSYTTFGPVVRMDPGPSLGDEETEETTETSGTDGERVEMSGSARNRGFVPPHVRAAREGGVGEVGWASSVGQ